MLDANRIGVTAKQLANIKRAITRLIAAEVKHAKSIGDPGADKAAVEWELREARREFNGMFAQRNVNVQPEESSSA